MSNLTKSNKKLFDDINSHLNGVKKALKVSYTDVISLETGNGNVAHWNGTHACDSLKGSLKQLKKIEDLCNEIEDITDKVLNQLEK